MGRPSFHAQVLIIPIPYNIIFIHLVKVAITIITIVVSVMLPVDICRGPACWENTAMCEKEEADESRWGKLVRMTVMLVIMMFVRMTMVLVIMRQDMMTN